MKYLFIDKNTWGYYDDELKLLGDYDSELGNIYVAKITKYDKKLDAFFIEYDKKKTGFLNNTKFTKNLKPSDEIIVQMTKESIGDKYPKFTTKITIETENLKYTNGDKLTFEGNKNTKISMISSKNTHLQELSKRISSNKKSFNKKKKWISL